MSSLQERKEATSIFDLNKEEVTELQTLLNKHGADLEIDGICGGYTAEAFEEFKNKYYQAQPTMIGAGSVALLLMEREDGAVVSLPVERQIDRLKQYHANPDLNTKTTYYSQRDNYTMRDRTCNSSSNAMYLKWLQDSCKQESISGDNEYLRKVLNYGDTIYHGVQTRAIKDYGFSTKWMTDRDFKFVKNLLLTGFPVVVNILHRGTINSPRGGHVIMLIDYNNEESKFMAHDPYGTLESNYTNHNGAYSKISEYEFTKRWQGGYRILA